MTRNEITDRLDALEAQLDDQQDTIDRQQERIEAQEAIIEAQRERLDADGGDADDSEEIDANGSDADGDDSERAVLNRRTALQAGGVLGLLGLGAGTASADASGQIGTSSDPLQQLYTEELNGGITGDAQLTNIAGSNLSIDSSGDLNASGGGSGAWEEGDNTNLLEPVSKDGIEVDTIADNGSKNLTVNTGGDRVLDLGTVTQTTINDSDVDGGGNVVAGHPLNSTSAVGAVISGGGMETTSGEDFPNTVSGDFGTIGGGIKNDASGLGATVGGGGGNTAGEYATVGGGSSNTASSLEATVGGGYNNTASNDDATVGGGSSNTANEKYSMVGGGNGNEASGRAATVGGGKSNTASGYRATVPGGYLNKADGDYSFAAGWAAEANGNNGAFVWGDSSSTTVIAGAADEVRFQATGGFVVENGNVDAQGGTVENTTGGLTITTNDNGDLTLDPGSGSSNDVFLKNLEINDDSILTVNSSGKVGIGSKAISDIGGGGSSSTLETGSTTGLEVTKPSYVPNVIGGNVASHTINNSPSGATILGGADDSPNTIGGDYATVAGGKSNEATAEAATVTGGSNNKCQSKDSVVVSGWMNETGTSGDQQTICGGKYNWANYWRAIVAGGLGNEATGDEAFAAGKAAVADNDQAFVWNDGTIGSATHPKNNSNSGDSNFPDSALKSSAEPAKSGVSGSQTFTVGASGGVRFITGGSQVVYTTDASAGWSTTSTKTAKTNIEPIEPDEVLAGVDDMTVSTWEYRDEDGEGKGTTHMGPTAEQFHEAFELGDSEKHINSMNLDGVALAAIQGLSQKLDDRDERIEDLEAENEQLRERNAELEDRLAAVEAELGIEASAGQQGVADD